MIALCIGSRPDHEVSSTNFGIQRMSLESTLKSVISRIHSDDLENEEEVKLAVILPTLLALDWDPAQSGSIKPEYPVGPGRVDYALLCHGRPQVFIEAKRRGALNVRAEEQLFGYASNQGIPLLVLTDGHYWDFYLSMAEGPPEERRFYRLDFSHEVRVPEYTEFLESHLRRHRVASGEARRSAETRLERSRERARARKGIPAAWRALLSEPDDLLRDLLIEKVLYTSGVRPEQDDVDEFLMSLPPVQVQSLRDGSLTGAGSLQPAGSTRTLGHVSVTADRHGTTAEALSEAAHNKERAGESLQDIIYDLMRVILEQYPHLLNGDMMNYLQFEKNPLGLRLSYPLIRNISGGRELKGYSRYKREVYAEQWYVCTEWNKPHHRHNALQFSSWIESLISDVGDASIRNHLNKIRERFDAYARSRIP